MRLADRRFRGAWRGTRFVQNRSVAEVTSQAKGIRGLLSAGWLHNRAGKTVT